MQAAVIEAPRQVNVVTIPDPIAKPGEVILRVGACGVCGTDIHIVDGEFSAVKFPLVPGHEFAGEVVEVGPDVQGISIGARVAVDPALACGRCDFCRRGRRNLCVSRGAIGGTANGAFAEYVAVPQDSVYLLPDGVSYQEAALVEPVSCVVHGMHMLSPRLGDSFLIFGAGTTGLMFIQLALRGGASRVDVVNRSERRLELAKRLGATDTSTDIQDLLEIEPLGYDCVVDATGVPSVMETAVTAVKSGGKLLIFGVVPDHAMMSISPYHTYREEITVMGSMGIHYAFAPAVDLIAGGAINTKAMLTHRLHLDEFSNALDKVRAGEGVKIQVVNPSS